MSDSERPDLAALRELERLIHHAGDELSGFRRRALVAEARVRELESDRQGGQGARTAQLETRVAELERENAELRARVEAASERARQLYDRVHFLRQQAQAAQAAPAAQGGER